MRTQLISDKELVSSYIKGNERALEILINRHKERIYSYIMMLVKDTTMADDVFQETFMKVVRTLKKGNYNEEGKFLPWVMRIAHNLVIDIYRKNQRMPQTSGTEEFDIFDVISEPDRNVEQNMIRDQIHEDLRTLIEELPDEQKEVLKMRHFGRMSFKAIAEETEVSINTALGRMRYALINLRKMIKDKNVDLNLR